MVSTTTFMASSSVKLQVRRRRPGHAPFSLSNCRRRPKKGQAVRPVSASPHHDPNRDAEAPEGKAYSAEGNDRGLLFRQAGQDAADLEHIPAPLRKA